MKEEIERMRMGECVYCGKRSHYKHATVTFLSVLGKAQKATMSIINISSLSCTIPNSPTVRRI